MKRSLLTVGTLLTALVVFAVTAPVSGARLQDDASGTASFSFVVPSKAPSEPATPNTKADDTSDAKPAQKPEKSTDPTPEPSPTESADPEPDTTPLTTPTEGGTE